MLVKIDGKQGKEQIVTSSRVVAEKFEKNHRDVLKAIRELMEGMRKTSQTPSEMFYETTYTSEQNGQKYPEFIMNRDGFSLLAMGFTGEKAVKWKLEYIKEFNAMETELRRIYEERQKWQIEREKGILMRHVLTDTIQKYVADTPHKRFAYPNYTKLIYKVLFGKNMAEMKEYYHVKGSEAVRQYLTADELDEVMVLERLISSLICLNWSYAQIKDFVMTNARAQISA